MANNQNLKPFKKGDPRASECGKKSKRKPLTEEWKNVDPAKLLELLEKQAQKGSTRAIEVILDRIYGKVTQGMDHTSKGDKITSLSGLSTEELVKRAQATKDLGDA